MYCRLYNKREFIEDFACVTRRKTEDAPGKRQEGSVFVEKYLIRQH